jgi:hypothetical protein
MYLKHIRFEKGVVILFFFIKNKNKNNYINIIID